MGEQDGPGQAPRAFYVHEQDNRGVWVSVKDTSFFWGCGCGSSTTRRENVGNCVGVQRAKRSVRCGGTPGVADE